MIFFLKRTSSDDFICFKRVLKYPDDLLLPKNALAEMHKSIEPQKSH